LLKINSYIAAYLLLIAVSLDLIGGRWAAYIISPLPGIYLPDLFYLTAIGLVISNKENIEIWFKRQSAFEQYLSIIALAWVVSKLGLSYFVFHEKLSYAIRDGAILFFLVSAPLAGIALSTVKIEKINMVLKWSALIYIILFLLTYLGLIKPFNSAILGGASNVRIFEFGGDLLGVMCGITYLFWSDASKKNNFDNLIVKILAIAPLIINNSRGGILATIIVVMLTILFIKRDKWKTEIIIISLGLLLGVCLALKPVKSFHGVPIYSTNIVFNVSDKGDSDLAFGIIKFLPPLTAENSAKEIRVREDKIEIEGIEREIFYIPFKFPQDIEEFFQRKGTVVARLATWRIIIEYHLRSDLWIIGAPYGSYVMQVACSNPNLPTYGTNYPGGGLKGPKCPVDSNETYSPVRDAHNAIVTIFTYNGILGLIIFLTLLTFQIRKAKALRMSTKAYALIALVGYAISGMFSTFALSSFALLPCAFLLALLTSQSLSDV
jgi:hypothetical protein